MTSRDGSRDSAATAGSGGNTALLLVDFINELAFDHGAALRTPAEEAARRTAELKRTLKQRGVVAIYANDNFGHWRSDFSQLVQSCLRPESQGRELARLLAPEPDDLSVLKPRHSAFYASPLEFLLSGLDVTQLVITGLVTDMCVLFTAHDAYLRQYRLWVPEDCVASVRPDDHRRTIEHLREVLGADTRPASSGAAQDYAGTA